MIGGHEQRRALGVVDGPVLGQRLGQHEDHDDLEEGGDQHAQRAEEPLRQDAHERGGHQLADQHEQKDRVQERLGVLDQSHEPARPSSALVAQRQGLGLAGTRQRGLGQRQQGRADEQHHDHPHQDDVGGPEVLGRRTQPRTRCPCYDAARWKRANSSRSRRSMVSASSSSPWSIPRRCSKPCTTSRATSSSRLTPCSTALRAATDGHTKTSPSSVGTSNSSLGKPAAGPGTALVGRPPPELGLLVDGKGEHVGRAGLAQEPLVELGDGGLVDEEQRHLDVLFDALGVEHVARQLHPPHDVDLGFGLLVGGEDVNRHRGALLLGASFDACRGRRRRDWSD